ncbi:Calcineurin-like phosphoesterase superfamily domain protein [Limihaloglobus sulfuriphilus]|uniref:Calcineurin-like phosphoesterase superfamily domain protein n=1 Tax=Limihaloglobus sulfuriphilus TaxID=1851148 RepID=A0A1Q2MAH4_9BACT|nr:metallophosphoesterase [Limihaloglobus sulfuriphilus]AQQ69725.1 Calcineurin-like phosphoesterase superfamily domain protein [Limihaloglobus sulfuriphilus]
MVDAVALYRQAASCNRNDKYRKGNVVYLPPHGRLIVSGDLHGNRCNFRDILNYADLEANPDTHLILQEIVHGGPSDEMGGCLSFQLVLRAAQLKCRFPEQVHFLMGNHDMSVMLDSEVLKDGKEMNESMKNAIDRKYGEDAEMVVLQMKQFLFSQPLAIRTSDDIFMSHSLPADRFVDSFDPEVLERRLQLEDMRRPNSAYLLCWGRNQSEETVNKMAQMLNARFFILGHQRQKDGFSRHGSRAVIIASDHYNGVIADIDLEKENTMEDVIRSIKFISCLE